MYSDSDDWLNSPPTHQSSNHSSTTEEDNRFFLKCARRNRKQWNVISSSSDSESSLKNVNLNGINMCKNNISIHTPKSVEQFYVKKAGTQTNENRIVQQTIQYNSNSKDDFKSSFLSILDNIENIFKNFSVVVTHLKEKYFQNKVVYHADYDNIMSSFRCIMRRLKQGLYNRELAIEELYRLWAEQCNTEHYEETSGSSSDDTSYHIFRKRRRKNSLNVIRTETIPSTTKTKLSKEYTTAENISANGVAATSVGLSNSEISNSSTEEWEFVRAMDTDDDTISVKNSCHLQLKEDDGNSTDDVNSTASTIIFVNNARHSDEDDPTFSPKRIDVSGDRLEIYDDKNCIQDENNSFDSLFEYSDSDDPPLSAYISIKENQSTLEPDSPSLIPTYIANQYFKSTMLPLTIGNSMKNSKYIDKKLFARCIVKLNRINETIRGRKVLV